MAPSFFIRSLVKRGIPPPGFKFLEHIDHCAVIHGHPADLSAPNLGTDM
nr:hypothetical protein [Bacillus sp. ISL-18]